MAVCALSVLDGLGQEATALGGVLVLFLALLLAWLSTHVADRGDHILGTILSVGAHASLIGLGGHDGYSAHSAPPPGEQANELQEEEPAEEEKPEEELLLDIRGGRMTRTDECEEETEAEEEEEEEEEEESSSITVRLKFLNDTEEQAVLRPHDTVGLLKSKLFSGREQQVKLIYRGQLLQDPQRSLLSLNITHNSVLHCHLSQPGGAGAGLQETPSRPRAGVALSTGSLVVPVFVVLLAVVWYFRIHYRQLFTAPATISLVGVTLFFSFLVFGMHSR